MRFSEQSLEHIGKELQQVVPRGVVCWSFKRLLHVGDYEYTPVAQKTMKYFL